MIWCNICVRYHIYGPCTATAWDEKQAWEELRKLIESLAKGLRA